MAWDSMAWGSSAVYPEDFEPVGAQEQSQDDEADDSDESDEHDEDMDTELTWFPSYRDHKTGFALEPFFSLSFKDRNSESIGLRKKSQWEVGVVADYYQDIGDNLYAGLYWGGAQGSVWNTSFEDFQSVQHNEFTFFRRWYGLRLPFLLGPVKLAFDYREGRKDFQGYDGFPMTAFILTSGLRLTSIHELKYNFRRTWLKITETPFIDIDQHWWAFSRIARSGRQVFEVGPGMTNMLVKRNLEIPANDIEDKQVHELFAHAYWKQLTGKYWGYSAKFRYTYFSTSPFEDIATFPRFADLSPGELNQFVLPEDTFVMSVFVGFHDLFFGLDCGYFYQNITTDLRDADKRESYHTNNLGIRWQTSF